MKIQETITLLAVAAFMMFSVAPAAAQSGGPYEIVSYTIDGGGATSVSGGAFELGGTIGQPDASETMLGGSFELTGGFWATVSGIPCLADFNGDGNLDIFDLFAFIDAFNNLDPSADLNNDSSLDIFDLFTFIAAFNAGCG
jgi:hypothetical protein